MKKLFILLLLFPFLIYSQTDSDQHDNLFQISGVMSFNFDTYHYTAKNYDSFRPRYQDLLMRLSGNLNIKIGEHLSIPIGLNVTNQEFSYNLPTIPEENFVDYIRNPRNNIHIDPTYKWLKMHFGAHTPRYSEFTVGDIQIFGVGIDVNPGKLIFSANYGTSQLAIEPDTIINNIGAYKQNIIAGRVGIGKSKGSKFTLNFVKIKDDVYSVNNHPVGVDPIEGFSLSPLIELKIAKKLSLKTETAVSIYTRNQLSGPLPFEEDIPDILLDINSINFSSNADFAHTSSLNWDGKLFSLGGEIKYIGPGFMPVGYRFIEKDIIDYKINSGIKLFKNKLIINGTYGIRKNNLNNTNLISTNRMIGNVNMFMQLSKSFNLNINYNNFDFNNNQNQQIARIQMTNSSLSISPTYRIQTETKNHVISSNLSINRLEQFDMTVDDFVDTESNTLNFNYLMVFQNIPLNMGISILSMENLSTVSDINMMNYQFISSYKMLDKKLEPSLSFNIANIKINHETPDLRLSSRIKVKYKINKKLDCNVSYLFNNYKYGSSKDGAILNENRFQFAVSQRF